MTPKTFFLRDDGTFPNHPNWPLLIYPSAISLPNNDPAVVEQVFQKNGWGGLWRNGIYSYHHYHSNSHEVLGVFSGSARVQFGGPNSVEVELKAGDVAVLPAGTAHKNLGSSPDFGVVGGYPDDTDYDLRRGNPDERIEAMKNIRNVRKPQTDPVFGADGGLCKLWPE